MMSGKCNAHETNEICLCDLKTLEKRPLSRPRLTWANILIILQGLGFAVVTLIHLPQCNSAIRKVQENQVGLKLSGIHQMLVYADDVNILGDYKHTIKKTHKL
jgi:hypothetical protein